MCECKSTVLIVSESCLDFMHAPISGWNCDNISILHDLVASKCRNIYMGTMVQPHVLKLYSLCTILVKKWQSMSISIFYNLRLTSCNDHISSELWLWMPSICAEHELLLSGGILVSVSERLFPFSHICRWSLHFGPAPMWRLSKPCST